MLAACGGTAAPKHVEDPLVRAEPVVERRFIDRVDAVGTARANEQVTLAAPVTQRIIKLNFDDGGYVRTGQVVAILAKGQEEAALVQAQATAQEAQQQLARIQALKSRGFATGSAVDTQVALAASARGRAEQARASITDRVIRAPFSGYVSLRTISTGAIVTAGTEIATISDTSRIKLDFAVPETLLSAVQPGQAIEARSAAFPNQPIHGTIANIDPVINPQTRAVTVRAILPNPGRRLLPGMLLTVTVESGARSALSVPELAIVGDGDRSFVFVADKGKAKRVQVKTGSRQDGQVEIVEGLRSGQQVVTEGVVKIADGQPIKLATTREAAIGSPKTAQP